MWIKSLAAAFIVATAALSPASAAPDAAPRTDADPQGYLTRAIEILKTEHLNRSKVDWPALEAEARKIAAGARTPEQTYPAIWYVITQLGDPHTQLWAPQFTQRTQAGQDVVTGVQRPDETPSGALLASRVAYVNVPGFMGDGARAAAYAEAGRGVLAELDRRKPCGWIIDLRHNTGGNMWPMLTALQGLLGDKPYGFWVDGDGRQFPWQQDAVLPPESRLQNGARPVAVLTGPNTSSSGEFTLIALRGRADIKVFGATTSGFVSANKTETLPDGAALLVSSAWSADRTGRTYTGPVAPDQAEASSQAAVRAAEAWAAHSCR